MKSNYIKVKWLRAHWSFAYSEGDIGYVTAESAAMLLKGGYVITLPDDEEEEKINPLPADLPGRSVLFAAGFVTLAELKEAGNSLLDAGISNTTLKKVLAYLKEK
jgi:hypothetical protein